MITAIIQARMGSTRLPGKTLMEIEGKPLLWHLLERIKGSRFIDKAVIATTYNPKDAAIIDFAERYGIGSFRGSEDDLLDRFYQTAKKAGADIIVRVTPDCPLVSAEIIDKVISGFLKGGCDYAANILLYTYPEGCDVEVFSFRALEKAWKECKDPSEREHVTPYMRNSGKFRIKNVASENPVAPDEYKWSVDRIEDLRFVREVYKRLYKNGRIFSSGEIMALLKKHPEIRRINSNSTVNEGYYRGILKSPAIKPKSPCIKKSLALKRKAEKVIPDCSQTFSKSPSQFVQGVAPVFLERGEGSHVWDVDGNEYIDYAMALGPIILGHKYPAVNDTVKKYLSKGITFSLPHRLEAELAQLLCDVIPCAEMVRFGKNGSDVTSGAVRAARAYTGRDIIACCGYHGWQDWYVGTTMRNKGVPEAVKKLTIPFKYNDTSSLKKIFAKYPGKVACVIMEPVGIEEPKGGFLAEVRKLTHDNGAVLIFDEIVTGFRFSLGGAQEYFNVIPDLACFGKAMGNGLPVSAVVGSKRIMKLFEEVFFSFTFGGEILSIAAAISTIEEIRERGVIRHIWEQGRKIKDGYNIMAREYKMERYTQCAGYPPRTVITFKDIKGEIDLTLKSVFQQECIKRGILFTGGHNVCFSHSNKDIDHTLRVYRTVLEILKEAIEKKKVKKMLEGEPLKPVFRKP